MGRYASKRKSRHYRPVSVKKTIKKNRKPTTDDPVIRDNWDVKKTLTQNYAALGLRPEVNPENQHPVEESIIIPAEPIITIPKDKGPSRKLLSEGEMEILCELMLVYKDNFKAMSRDMKRNPYQLTKKQLKKKCLIFKKNYEGTRFDPIFKPYNQELIEKVQKEEKQEL